MTEKEFEEYLRDNPMPTKTISDEWGDDLTDKPLGLKPLDYHADIMNIVEPIINLDSPTKQEEYLKKKIIEALEDIPKPKKT